MTLVYLAYQIEENQLTESILARILDDYFDFNDNKPFRNSKDFFNWIPKRIDEISFKNPQRGTDLTSKSLFEKVTYFSGYNLVKNHPLFEISLDKNSRPTPYCPENLTGLNIWPGHSGTEGIVDLLNFKPEMDAYLHVIGIDYFDRSKTTF